MGFFATIGRGWEMSKLSMAVVKKDPELVVYMIIAGVMSLACLIGMNIPQFLEMEWAVNPDGSFTGADTTTRFTPHLSTYGSSFSVVRKTPVHSITSSTPRPFQSTSVNASHSENAIFFPSTLKDAPSCAAATSCPCHVP